MPSMGEYWAELSVKGLDGIKSAFKEVEKGMNDVAERGGVLGIALDKLSEKGGIVGLSFKGLTSVFNALKPSIIGVTGLVYGFATAGIAGSVQGERLGFQMKQLSLSIGSIFVPVVENAISVVSKLTNYLRDMDGETQGSVLKWAGLAGGVALFASGIGTIPGILLAATSAFSLLGDISESTMNAIVERIGKVTDIMIPLGKSIWDNLVGAFQAALPVISIVGDLIAQVIGGAIEIITPLLETLADAFKSAWELISETIQLVAPIIKTSIGVVLEALKGLAWVLDKLIQSLSWIVKQIKGVISSVREEISGVIAETEAKQDNVATEQPQKKEKQKRERTDLIPKSAGGFEGIGSAYTRIAQSVINQFDPAKAAKKAEEQREKQVGFLEKIAARVGNKQPALAGV